MKLKFFLSHFHDFWSKKLDPDLDPTLEKIADPGGSGSETLHSGQESGLGTLSELLSKD